MLTAAIVTGDTASAAQLLASLEQTGLVNPAIKQWTVSSDKLPDAGEVVADIVLLDLGRDPEPFFIFGTHLRRIRPSTRLIACSATNPPNPQMLLDAMRSGVQDFVAKPVTPAGAERYSGALHSGRAFDGKGCRQADCGDGFERRRGSDDGRREPGSAAFARIPTSALCCSILRGRSATRIFCSICTRALAFATRSTVWTVSTATFSRGLLERHKSKLEISGWRHAAGRVAKHPHRAAEQGGERRAGRV